MLPSKRILITAISETPEAQTLRAVVESFHVSVDFVGIGETRDLIDILNACQDVAVVVICCHGKKNAIPMPELGEPLAGEQPFQGPLTPEHVRTHLKLRGRRLLCTGCSTGNEAMGRAFLDAGCEWVVAPDGDPHGAEALMFIIHFLYLLLHRGMSVADAVEGARSAEDDRGLFRLFQAKV